MENSKRKENIFRILQNGKMRYKVDKFETPNSLLGARFYFNLPKNILRSYHNIKYSLVVVKRMHECSCLFSLREND